MSAILPAHIYTIIASPENAALFEDPVRYKAELEALFHRKLRIYTEGQRMPRLSLTLLSAISPMQPQIEPSGLFKLPVHEHDLVKNSHAIDKYRYLTPAKKAHEAFRGSVYPTDITNKMTLAEIRDLKSIDVTQMKLFQRFPGVHFNLLCRSVMHDQDELERLVVTTAPEIYLTYVTDLFGTVDEWLKTDAAARANPAKVAQMRAIVERVMSRRRLSGEAMNAPDFERVVNSILAKGTPKHILEEQLAKLDPRDVAARTERREGLTLLGLAATAGNKIAVDVLLRYGAPVDTQDKSHKTALMIALDNAQVGVAAMLLDAGASITITDMNGQNALMHACTDDLNEPLIPGLIGPGSIKHADINGDTALSIAAAHPHPSIVQLLLMAGADVTTTNNRGDTPLITACANAEYKDKTDVRKYTAIAEMLLDAGADIRVRNREGRTALTYALNARLDRLAALLVARGASPKMWLRSIEFAGNNKMPRTLAAAIAAREEGRPEDT